ncbi:MAG: Jag N-terminal domain-containing protein, partial [Oscillospiraceae bacterium]|nr:Jag N-terminal domain-containing protein [Oscillospiraceae bacterium]
MIKTADFTGKTEESAVEAGLASLGLERDEVSVEIIERAKSGFLGFGSSPAVVRLSYEVPDPVPETPVKPERAPQAETGAEKKDRKKPARKPEPPKAESPKAAPRKDVPAAPKQDKSAELSPKAK